MPAFSLSAAALVIRYVMPFRGVSRGPTTTSIGGPFTLVDDTGSTVTEKTLAGKPYTMYFGYTFCPDVCPTTLLDLSRWIKKLGPNADRLNYVFVTVDPERDTVQSLHHLLVIIRQAHPRLHRHTSRDRSDREGVSSLLQESPDG